MSNPARVFLATGTESWDVDDDAQPLVEALEAVGVQALPAVWTDPDVDWSEPDAVVIRSTWDYADKHQDYLEWIDRVAACNTLLNPADMVRWNVNKRYMTELDNWVEVVDTYFVDGHNPSEIRTAVHRSLASRLNQPAATDSAESSREYVVKPTISAGSRDTGRFTAADIGAACDLAAEIADSGREVMVQPYLKTVDSASETGLVYFNGEFSHSFEKGAILTPHEVGSDKAEHGLFALERIGPRQARPDQLELADRVVEEVGNRFGEAPLYARVDLLDSADDAHPVVLELEVTEPSWFLATSPGAADTAARAIRARLPLH
jgi:hypothetical protein